jgi:hypothetical protein
VADEEEDLSLLHWVDQFGALLRDKCRQMQEALWATGWDSMAHAFVEPQRGETWRLTYQEGEYYLTCLDGESAGEMIVLDLDSLGVHDR